MSLALAVSQRYRTASSELLSLISPKRDDSKKCKSRGSAPPVSATTTGLGNGLAATYYDNIDFSGSTATRTDQAISFLWNSGQAPISGIAANTFTADWTGQILAPTTGTYKFSALSDDGARVWINNQLVLNDWDVHSPSTRTGTIDLVANNKYDIKVEYFQNAGSAEIYLNWVVPGASTGTNAVAIPTANLYSQSPNQPPAAPAAPTGVYAAIPVAIDAVTTPRIQVSWEEVTGADVYVVYRSADGGATWSVAGSALAGSTMLSDNDPSLDLSKHYTYSVMAIGAGGRSAAVKCLDTPQNLTVVPTSDGTANVLTWTPDPAGITGWYAERSTDNGVTWTACGTAGKNDSLMVDPRNAGAGATYLYRMMSTNSGVGSAWSLPTAAPLPGGVSTPSVDLSLQLYNSTDLSGTPTTGTVTYVQGNGDVQGSNDSDYLYSHNNKMSLTAPTGPYSGRISARIIAPVTGDYRFSLKADVGARFYLDGSEVFENWQDASNKSGDTNLDGIVNFADLVAVAQHYGFSGMTRAEGDLTGDGNVTFADLVMIAQQYGQTQDMQTLPDAADLQAIHLTANQSVPFTIEFFNQNAGDSIELDWTTPTNNVLSVVPVSAIAPPDGSGVVLAPTGLSLGETSNAVAVSWNSVAGASQYVINRSDDNGQNYSVIATLNGATTYSDATAAGDTDYLYRVQSVSSAGRSDFCDPASITTNLRAPTGLAVVQIGDQTAHVSWTSMGGLGGYIERATVDANGDPGPFSNLTFVGAGITQWDDTTIQLNNGYLYQLAGANQNRAGEQIVLDTSELAAPGNFRAVATGYQVELTWDEVEGADHYTVFSIKDRQRDWTPSGLLPVRTSSYAFELPDDDTYYFCVVASKTLESGESYSLRSAIRAAKANASPDPIPIQLPHPPLPGPGPAPSGPGNGQDGAGAPQIPSPPTGLTVDATEDNSSVESDYMHLSWTAVAGAWGYNLYRAEGSASSSAVPFKLGLTDTTYDDWDVLPGVNYTYTLSALVSDLESKQSTPVARAAKVDPDPDAPGADLFFPTPSPGYEAIFHGDVKTSIPIYYFKWDRLRGATSYTIRLENERLDDNHQPVRPAIWDTEYTSPPITDPFFEKSFNENLANRTEPFRFTVTANYDTGSSQEAEAGSGGQYDWNDRDQDSLPPDQGKDDLYLLDLHTDSINADELGSEDSSDGTFPHEDEYAADNQIEANFSQPGKILLVNDGDRNGNGKPDFADGISSSTIDAFIPMELHLVPGVDVPDDPNDPQQQTEVDDRWRKVFSLARLSFNYNASDPADNPQVPQDGDNAAYQTSAGTLRVYYKDTSGSFHFVEPNVSGSASYFPLSELGFQENNDVQTLQLYVEAVRPSQRLADLSVSVHLDRPAPSELVVDDPTTTPPTTHIQIYNAETSDSVNFTAIEATANDAAYSGLVRLADGGVKLSSQELSTGGFGLPWGQTLTYNSQLVFGLDSSLFGRHLEMDQMPHLLNAYNSIIAIQGGDATFFDKIGDAYIPRFGSHSTLTAVRGSDANGDGVGDVEYYVLADDAGNRVYFNNFDKALQDGARGRMTKFVSADNNQATVGAGPEDATAQNFDGHIQIESRGDGQEEYVYTYDSSISSTHEGMLTGVTIRRPQDGGWLIVSQVTYDSTDEGFNATIRDGTNNGAALGTFKYGINSTSLLRSFMTPSVEARAGNSIPDYALQYDASGKVSSQTVLGAGASSTTSDSGAGHNSAMSTLTIPHQAARILPVLTPGERKPT